MPKRKCECKEERYQRKIKRLKRKLKKNKARSNENRSPSPVESSPPSPVSSCDEAESDADVEILDTDPAGAECVINTQDKDPSTEVLDDTIIKALGQTLSSEKEYGPDIHLELKKRVEGIIINGLKQETKDELVKKYLVPSNLKLLDAPKLNKELEGLLNDAMKARDKRVQDRQQQIGIATAALLCATDKLIKGEVDKISLISTISDVTRLLTDLHYQDTITRKKLVIPSLDQNVGKTVENQERDEFLFGEKFNENVKSATAIKKSAGTILKQNSNRKTNYRPTQSQKSFPKKQGNYKGRPRASMTQFKQGGGGRYQQTQSYKPRPPPRPPVKAPVRQS
ncbi:uncharacterized protein LOC135117020 [Helicoverpa armigera]|uniref:uncharacterized protein LOC135117020 n=1 Tax=Helicoverpa armigera TaxID=29058 RepID=UPI0030829507